MKTGAMAFKVASLNARPLKTVVSTPAKKLPPQGGRRDTSPTTVRCPTTEIPQADRSSAHAAA